MRMCPYCLIEPATIVADNKLVVAVRNASPLAPLHTLILPRRHVPNYFELFLREMMGVEFLRIFAPAMGQFEASISVLASGEQQVR
jgi:diadenosine tetraphosphate (Ap4A) HIT family hydrolase